MKVLCPLRVLLLAQFLVYANLTGGEWSSVLQFYCGVVHKLRNARGGFFL